MAAFMAASPAPRWSSDLAEWPIRVCIKLLPPQSFGAVMQEKQARVPALG
jgi:hypothetical protein